MPRKLTKGICEICGIEFESNSFPFPRSCKNKDCRHKIKVMTNGNIGKQEGKWSTKVCPVCGKEFETRISRENTYCSNDCNLRSEERKENNKRLYTGVSLLDRGYSQKQYDTFTQNTIDRNKENAGYIFEEIYGEEKSKEIKKKLSIRSSGNNNPMSYRNVMERFEVYDYDEAKELMPATGRFGKLHPFYGKHHSIYSKKKMMETFENSSNKSNVSIGYFNGIFFQGTWELKYIIDCYENNIPIKRYNLEPFLYYYEDKPHHYFPDFIINNTEIIEIKGMDKNNGRTISKNKQFSEKYDNYKIIYDVGQKQNPQTFLRLAKEKYDDKLVIKHNPYGE